MGITRILFALASGAENKVALERAVQLARDENAKLTVCDVIDTTPRDYGRLITAITSRELTDLVISARLERIDAMLKTIDCSGLMIDRKVLIGTPHNEILRLVQEYHYDLVMLPVTGRRIIGRRPSMRDYRELMRHCPCPVWLVNVAEKSGSGSIVAALGKPQGGAVTNRLNEHILTVSRSIALAAFRPLHIVHAWILPGEGHYRARASVETNREVDAMVEREAAIRKAWLEAAVYTTRSADERIANNFIAPELHAVKGIVSNVLPDLAKDLGAELIVMGTAGRTGLRGMLIRNTSETVLSGSDCSLLIVKEPDSLPSAATNDESTSKSRAMNIGRPAPTPTGAFKAERDVKAHSAMTC